VPFLVSRVLIRYVFDFPLIMDDFDGWTRVEGSMSATIKPYKKQLDAIKLGVLKMRPIKFHSYIGLAWFPRVVQMMPFIDFKKAIERHPLCKLYVLFKQVRNVLEMLKNENCRQRVT
jgi:hypothetical protein